MTQAITGIEPELEQTVERIFHELGMTTTEAVRLFYKQVVMQRGLPFAVKLPAESSFPEYEGWMALSQESLANAYSDDEPDYSVHMIREVNPDYEGG
jgi:addiction module RelB/DinJ family antitoxin